MMEAKARRGLFALLLCTAACAKPAPQPGTAQAGQMEAKPADRSAQGAGEAPAPAPLVAIPGAAQPLPGVLSGGQPTPEQLAEAAARGYRSVISLRPEGEPGSEGERAEVERLGMRFVSIPVAGAADLTEQNARALGQALSAEGAVPAILHCGTGNRAGALLALEAYYVEGKSAEEALDLGKRAGLTKLEPTVREKLAVPVTTH